MKDASCDCKASALGRRDYVDGLPFALLDWSEKGQQSCTKLCEWKVGRKAKRPKVLHKSEYPSVSGKPVERAKKSVETMNLILEHRHCVFQQIRCASIASLATCNWH